MLSPAQITETWLVASTGDRPLRDRPAAPALGGDQLIRTRRLKRSAGRFGLIEGRV